jgi:hypothetical protein
MGQQGCAGRGMGQEPSDDAQLYSLSLDIYVSA